jgi:4'-phosphopantetheinyl transferase EntD
MASTISALSFALHQAFPGVVFELAEGFGANTANHRQKLRESLFRRSPDPALFDFTKPPQFEGNYASVAHCQTLGGYAFAEWPIGFDIEETTRVSSAIANRIRDSKDAAFPNPAAFWTAKEAAYKALGPRQPTVIGDVVITEWAKLEANHWSFRSVYGQGQVWISGPWAIAVFQPVSN